MAIDYVQIGRRLQTQRKACGLTQEALAEQVNITTVYLSKVENGHVRPTLDLLDALCDALEYDLSVALTGVMTSRPEYGNERVIQLFRACPDQVKPVALNILEQLTKLE